eukprot:TRINITY_DN12120_c0_g1_i1.p1 TRINITY_DN12120_c0_g1~~TRINITY_DN12120_c0_g1_i1.p1  ORF type:complete len:192 (-),score=57.33 TRINITY_DN12120_c0_g1_i1:43-561(-)
MCIRDRSNRAENKNFKRTMTTERSPARGSTSGKADMFSILKVPEQKVDIQNTPQFNKDEERVLKQMEDFRPPKKVDSDTLSKMSELSAYNINSFYRPTQLSFVSGKNLTRRKTEAKKEAAQPNSVSLPRNGMYPEGDDIVDSDEEPAVWKKVEGLTKNHVKLIAYHQLKSSK